MPKIASLLTITMVTAILGQDRAAQAEAPNKAAKAHADRGVREYNLEHYVDAIAEFEKAYQIDPAPILLYDLAQAYRKNGNLERALSFFRRYLDQAPDAPNRTEVETRIRDIDTKLKSDAATKSPAPSLPLAPAAPPPSPSPNLGTPNAVEPQAAEPPASQFAAVGEPHRWMRPTAWATGAGAVVALGTGLVFTLRENSKFSKFDQSCVVDNGKPVNDPNKPSNNADCPSLYSDWNSSKTSWPIVGYVAAGVLGATSAVLFVVSGKRAHPTETHALLTCEPTLNGVTCGGIF